MKRFLLTTGVIMLVAPASAIASPPTHAHRVMYLRLYTEARHAAGAQAVGCELGRTCRSPNSDQATMRSIGVLERIVAPAPAPARYVPTAGASAYLTGQTHAYPAARARTPSGGAVASSAGGYSIPSSIVQCESGGNWNAVNPSSGAGGAYQIMPSTWAAYGGQGSPQTASPAEQSAIASRIYASQGAAAWSCK